MEQRLIDANALKNDINAQVEILNILSVSTGIDELRQIGEELQRGMVAEIDKQPTVDAVPVVHGYWTTKRTWQHDGEIYCSACDHDAPTEGDYRQVKTNYCPNCGAKMDGKEDVRRC